MIIVKDQKESKIKKYIKQKSKVFVRNDYDEIKMNMFFHKIKLK